MTKKRQRYFRKGTNWETKWHDDDVIPGLDGTPNYREACNFLRQSWRKFKIAKWNDDELSMEEAAETINKIQVALRIAVTNFAGYNHEMTKEENAFERERALEEEEFDEFPNEQEQEQEQDPEDEYEPI